MSIRQYALTWTGILTTLLLTLQSCSVKEDRMDCPCYLTIDMSSCEDGTKAIITELDEDNNLKNQVSDFTNEDDRKETYKVKKGPVNVCCIYGQDIMYYDKHKLFIPFGNECDSIWAYSETVSCTKEKIFQNVDLRKQYADIQIEFYDGSEKEFPYDVFVVGNYNGIDLLTLNPIPGGFSAKIHPKESFNKLFDVRVPRQGDNSLEIELFKGDEMIDTIPIGEKISAQGYSWTDKDLNDIFIKIDYTRTEITVSVLPWTKEGDKDMNL